MDIKLREFMAQALNTTIKPAPIAPRNIKCKHGSRGCDGWCEPVNCTDYDYWDYEPQLFFCEACMARFNKEFPSK
jgi:hypothetical protein